VCHALHDPAFFRFLTQIDAQLAAEARERRCPECAGPLHVADFARKPRGCPASVREEYSCQCSSNVDQENSSKTDQGMCADFRFGILSKRLSRDAV